ncbi:uncharacterized protein B0T15DRAFT_513786 [Chaetomium strumarium]|uniref:Uncharacterized protein n=1 Tax=Chaetomium strumarium TaxID=1170767 RepID=A0AAJ0GP76_9PEZI|nr:hypothetical protein B0T15DRAFT_513786 [Chaetomium strumarium]
MCRGVILNFWCPCTWSGHEKETRYGGHGAFGHSVVRQLNLGAYRWCSDYFPSEHFQLGLFIPNCPKSIDHDWQHTRSTTLCDECKRLGCPFQYKPRSNYGHLTAEERRIRDSRWTPRERKHYRSKRARNEPATPPLRTVDASAVVLEQPKPTRTPVPRMRTPKWPSGLGWRLVRGGTAEMLDVQWTSKSVCNGNKVYNNEEVSPSSAKSAAIKLDTEAVKAITSDVDNQPQKEQGSTDIIHTKTAGDNFMEVAQQVREKYTHSYSGDRPGAGRLGGRARSNTTAALGPRPVLFQQTDIQIYDDDDNDDVDADVLSLDANQEGLRCEQEATDEEWAELIRGLNYQMRPGSRASDRSEASTPSTVIGKDLAQDMSEVSTPSTVVGSER